MRQRSNSLTAGAVFLAISMVTVPLRVSALSLGDLVVESAPGEPLRAMIPITLEPDESLAELRVGVASQADYAGQQLERPALLQGLRIALQAKGEQQGRIRLSGEQAWQGEEALILLELNWPQGELKRRFRIIPVSSEAEQKPRYVEVTENESLATIAMRLSEQSNRSYMHMMVALYRANPEAFYRNNLNNLKRGARLRVPSSKELYQLSDSEVFATLREHEKRLNKSGKTIPEEEEKAQQLEQLRTENSQIEQRNRELKERLGRLEQQMSSVSRQVLEQEPIAELVPAPTEPVDEPLPPAPEPEPSAVDEKHPVVGGEQGLSLLTVVSLMLIVTAAVAGIWRFAPQSGKGE